MTPRERRERAQAMARELRLTNLYEHQLERMSALHRSALEAMESGQAREAQDRLARHAQCQMRCRALWQELQRQRPPAPALVSAPDPAPGVWSAARQGGPPASPPASRVPGPGRRTPRPPSPPLADPVLSLEGIEEEVERELESLRMEIATR